MTRFARAKGSKASNERVPEESTPWNEMKKQLLEKNRQVVDTEKKQKAEKQREENYKSFLEEVENDKLKNTKWADFPNLKPENNQNGIKKIKKKKLVNDKQRTQKTDGIVTEKTKLIEDNNNTPEMKKTEKIDGSVKRKRKSREDNNNTSGNADFAKKKTEETYGPVNKKTKRSEDSKNTCENVESEKKKLETKIPTRKGSRNRKGKKDLKSKTEQPAKKEPLTEEDLKKIEKKKQKKMRQLEKRKLKKQNDPNSTNPTPKKISKFKDNKQKGESRKKPQNTMIINGEEIQIAYVDGFPIKKEDADRIHQLRRQMISKGLPRSEIKIALKLERRKAEKALAREKKKVCFNCRKSGHNLSECPNLNDQIAESSGTGICFKCGSTEHTHFECKVVKGQEFKFAQCFICHEQGHIARQCPDNARGLYPKGGACKVCGDVTHLKKDCPKYQAQQQQLQDVQIETISSNDNPDSLSKNEEFINKKETKRPNKIIKFF